MPLLDPIPWPCEYAWNPPEPEEPVQKFEQITLEGDTQVSCDPDAPHHQFLRVEDWNTYFTFSAVEAQSIYDLLHKYFGAEREASDE